MRLDQCCHQLVIFLEVAQCGSVTRAAEILVMSQPAVSAQVSALERALGMPLLERRGRGIQLTHAGELVALYARRIFGLADELSATLDDLRGLATGRLVLGSSTTVGEYLLPETLGRFNRDYPGIAIELRIANTQRTVERILDHSLDLAFIGEQVAHERLVQMPYCEDEVVPVVAAGHPLAGRSNVPPEDVMAPGLIVREAGSATRATAERHLRSLGLRPAVLLELGSNEAVKRAVRAGAGVAFLSRRSIEAERLAGLLAVVDAPALVSRRAFQVIYRRDKRLSIAETAFLRFALEPPAGDAA